MRFGWIRKNCVRLDDHKPVWREGVTGLPSPGPAEPLEAHTAQAFASSLGPLLVLGVSSMSAFAMTVWGIWLVLSQT